jgi:hypothetical protein
LEMEGVCLIPSSLHEHTRSKKLIGCKSIFWLQFYLDTLS